MPNLEKLVQEIALQVTSPVANLKGIDDAMARLKAFEKQLEETNAAISKVMGAGGFQKSSAQFQAQIKGKGPQSTETLAKMFGFTPAQVTAYGAEIEAALRAQMRKIEQAMAGMGKFTPKGRASRAYERQAQQLAQLQAQSYFTGANAQTLKSPVAAGKFFEAYSAQQAREMGMQKNVVRQLLRGGGGAGGAGAAVGVAGAKVIGEVKLEIPASQIKATVAGEVQVAVGGVARGPGGRFTGGGGRGGGGTPGPRSGGGAGGEAVAPDVTARELQRVVATRGEDIKTTVTELAGIGETVAVTYDEVANEISRRVTTRQARPLLEKIKQQKANYLSAMAGASADPLTQAGIREEAAGKLMGIISPDELALLQSQGISGPQTMLSSRAATLRGQASVLREKAFLSAVPMTSPLTMEKDIVSVYNERQKRLDNATALGFGSGVEVSDQEMRRIQNVRGRQQGIFSRAQRAMQSGVPPIIPGAPPPPRPPGGARGPGGFGVGKRHWAQGFMPGQYAQNVATVAGWAAAVYPVMMVRDAMEKLAEKTAEVQMQTARLGNVFRGVGGSAQDLTQDILKVAAATGVDADTAMATATAWARLGLTRQQVVSATRQTAILSNTGQIPQAEGQQYLRDIMSNYKLGPESLKTVVSMLTTTAARSGTTQADLLEGISKAAPVASANGMGLAELMGIVAVGTKRAAQGGTPTGNDLRTIFSDLNRSEVRKSLEGFGIVEPRGGNLSSYWRQVATAYASMNRDTRQQMQISLAGIRTGSRLGAYLEGYPEEQELARQSTQNPEAGAEAQRKMMGTIGQAWTGLTSEAEQEIMGYMNRTTPEARTGDMTPGGTLAQGITVLKNSIRLLSINSALSAKFANISGVGMKSFNDAMEEVPLLTKEEARAQILANRARLSTSANAPAGTEEAAAAAGAYDADRQEVLNYLRQRLDLTKGIAEINKQLSPTGSGGAVLTDQVTLQMQDKALGDAMNHLKDLSSHADAHAKEQAFNALNEQRMDVEAQISATPVRLALAHIEDARSIAVERAQGFAGEAGLIGHTPFEQMLNREGAVTHRIDQLEATPRRTDMQSAELLALQHDRYQTRVAEARRVEELPFLMEQNRREAQRSFNRETLFAGPQELLARIGVMRLAESNHGRGINARQFMALSPEDRRFYDELHGGEEGARLREEARLARRNHRALTPEQEAAEQRYTQTDQAHTSRGLAAAVAPIEARLAEAQTQQMHGAAAAAAQLNSLAGSAHSASAQLAALGANVGILNEHLGHGAGSSWGPEVSRPQGNPQSGGQVLGLPAGDPRRSPQDINGPMNLSPFNYGAQRAHMLLP